MSEQPHWHTASTWSLIAAIGFTFVGSTSSRHERGNALLDIINFIGCNYVKHACVRDIVYNNTLYI